MQKFLKIVGNGKRTARNLSPAEAAEAIELVLSGQASTAQVAAFMAALRIKEETGEELTAFAEALRRYSTRLDTHHPLLVEVCLPYDGRAKSPNLIPAAALIAAAAGAKVALHGRVGQNTPPKFGVGVGDVLARLGIPVDLSVSAAMQVIEDAAAGVAYVDVSQFSPRLETFIQIRLDYGMRSFFNTIEKLINPFNAGIAIMGVFHEPVMQQVATAMQAQHYARGIVVHGPEGSTDVLSSRRTTLLEFGNPARPALTEWSIDPNRYGAWDRSAEITGALTPESNAALTVRLLDPEDAITGTENPLAPYRQGALLTAAMILYVADQAPTFEQAFGIAQAAFKDGSALRRLDVLRTVNSVAVDK